MEIRDYNEYLIHNDGRVYSNKYNPHNGTYHNDFLKLAMNESGYHTVKLYNQSGESKSFLVHRLVALHYVENTDPEEKDCVDHIDGNKTNNHYTNLRWTTKMENSNNYQKKRINNNSGISNIYFDRNWRYSKRTHGKNYTKRFKTRDEAIAHKLIHEIFIKYE